MKNKDKLVAVVLGNSNSGKTTTWNRLFKQKVRTSNRPRRLVVKTNSCIEVFLVNGSAEERNEDIETIIDVNVNVRIILCSIQYRQDCVKTIDFLHNSDFEFYVHWLNPGYKDDSEYQDHLGIVRYLRKYDARIEKYNAKINPDDRVDQMRNYLYKWSNAQGILMPS